MKGAQDDGCGSHEQGAVGILKQLGTVIVDVEIYYVQHSQLNGYGACELTW